MKRPYSGWDVGAAEVGAVEVGAGLGWRLGAGLRAGGHALATGVPLRKSEIGCVLATKLR